MDTVKFDPDAAKNFQMFLLHSSERINEARRRIQSAFSELGATWKDAKYGHFARTFEETMFYLEQYDCEMTAYLDYLRRKEMAIREYREY